MSKDNSNLWVMTNKITQLEELLEEIEEIIKTLNGSSEQKKKFTELLKRTIKSIESINSN
jgi:hypothetical protein